MEHKHIFKRLIDKLIALKEHFKHQALEAPEVYKPKLPPKDDSAHARAEMFRMYEGEDLGAMEAAREPEPELWGPQPSEFVKQVWHEKVEPEAQPESLVEETPEPPLLEPSEFVKKVWMTDEVASILETEGVKGKKRSIQRVGIVLVSEDKVRKPAKKARKPAAKKSTGKSVKKTAPARKKKNN